MRPKPEGEHERTKKKLNSEQKKIEMKIKNAKIKIGLRLTRYKSLTKKSNIDTMLMMRKKTKLER